MTQAFLPLLQAGRKKTVINMSAMLGSMSYIAKEVGAHSALCVLVSWQAAAFMRLRSLLCTVKKKMIIILSGMNWIHVSELDCQYG